MKLLSYIENHKTNSKMLTQIESPKESLKSLNDSMKELSEEMRETSKIISVDMEEA